ncbi:Eukaryotic translation initiation factor 3 subunit C [Monoraphidium neglectum]|uniref:Eukaryotic translation initiation factor 3 subunit C n=1 Tax=Monoraphidium neglectum TaxID=145388 RepID=A0A0D2JNL9_9CHLO|nr:Eukaryotic translation initiation factor 3 subunit C [Monoraphidium neglectum]KIZ00748.1 Eukaryotic translation initiation factor 3 subunit C [Monoraphidium neglectum]|eukprot:XP_013899767.1 Eukaryotic translation initiation factor 3 subunit C [Monoraphidium neglectum]
MASRFWAAPSSEEEEDDNKTTSSEEDEGESSSSSSSGSSSSSSSSGSESDSESGSDSDSDSDDSDGSGKKGAARFLAGSSDSESEDDRKVQLRSNRDKVFAALYQTCEDIRNKFKNNDWSAIVTLFDDLNKNLEKVQKVTPGVPKGYVRILGELEGYLTTSLANKEQKKKMSATNSKALNTMRQRLKKHNVAFADQLAKYREDPAAFGSDAEEEEESSSSSESEEGSGAEDEGEERVDKRIAPAKKKDKILTMDPSEITYEMVNRKMREIIATRGRRGTDKQEQAALRQLRPGL